MLLIIQTSVPSSKIVVHDYSQQFTWKTWKKKALLFPEKKIATARVLACGASWAQDLYLVIQIVALCGCSQFSKCSIIPRRLAPSLSLLKRKREPGNRESIVVDGPSALRSPEAIQLLKATPTCLATCCDYLAAQLWAPIYPKYCFAVFCVQIFSRYDNDTTWPLNGCLPDINWTHGWNTAKKQYLGYVRAKVGFNTRVHWGQGRLQCCTQCCTAKWSHDTSQDMWVWCLAVVWLLSSVVCLVCQLQLIPFGGGEQWTSITSLFAFHWECSILGQLFCDF